MKRVLVLGDRRVAGLRSAGAEVAFAKDAREARAELAATGDDVGLVILTPELAEQLEDWFDAHPRVLWTAVRP